VLSVTYLNAAELTHIPYLERTVNGSGGQVVSACVHSQGRQGLPVSQHLGYRIARVWRPHGHCSFRVSQAKNSVPRILAHILRLALPGVELLNDLANADVQPTQVTSIVLERDKTFANT